RATLRTLRRRVAAVRALAGPEASEAALVDRTRSSPRPRGAPTERLERREGPICFVGALGCTLDVQGVRLACSLRAPPRSWTRLLALGRRFADGLPARDRALSRERSPSRVAVAPAGRRASRPRRSAPAPRGRPPA